jgi:hypothetical protein
MDPTANSLKILQWNSHSITPKIGAFHKLIDMYCPQIICLSETWLAENMACNLKSFNIFRKDRNDKHGGVLIGICKSLKSHHIAVNLTNPKIEIVARKISVDQNTEFDVASVYIPPKVKITNNDMAELLCCLEEPFFIIGDLNGHGMEWGCVRENERGKIIQETLDELECTTINNGAFTRLQPLPRVSSALDIAITNNANALNCKWEVINNSCGSDHLPAITVMKLPKSSHNNMNAKVSIKKTSMKKFYSNLRDPDLIENCNIDTCTDFKAISKFFNKVEEKSQVVIKINVEAKIKPWWNADCSLAFAKIIVATKKFKKKRKYFRFSGKKES